MGPEGRKQVGWRRDKEDGGLIEVPSDLVERGGEAEAADKRAVDMVRGRGSGHGADRAAAGDAARDRLGVDTTPAGGRFGVRTTPAGERQSDPDPTRVRVHRPGLAAPRDGGGAGARVGGLAVRPASGHGDPAASVDGDPMDDPPVGWLVIVAGPGRGRVATLGNNRNFIGRDRGQRVSLDYGDDTISREGHGEIVYDPNHRGFHVGPGTGTNLTYVKVREGDFRQLDLYEPVLAHRPLEPLAYLWMGNTVLRFVPLCGGDFSWEDGSDEG